MKYFLGLEIARPSKGIILSQRHYTLQLLEDTGFLASKPASIPMDPKISLNSFDGELLSDATQFRRLIGCLLYLTLSRPNITFVIDLASFCPSLGSLIFKLHTIFLDILNHALVKVFFLHLPLLCSYMPFSDAYWASCADSRKSVTSFCVFLGDSLVSWKGKMQYTISQSFSEVKY